MWWLTCFVMLTSPFLYECENAPPTEDEYKSMLQDAVTEVLSTHSEEMSRPRSYAPPHFNVPDNFMRSFRPGTGVGNREELIIDNILSWEFFVESDKDFSSFLFKHFDNEDYVIGISSYSVAFHKIDSSMNYTVLSMDNIVFSKEYSGIVKDVVLFTRFNKHSEILYVGVLVESTNTDVVYVYEISGSVFQVAVIDLKLTPDTSARKLAYVQSSLEGSLVVLVQTKHEVELNYKQQSVSVELSNYIEVKYPSAIDLVTFTVQGHGYIAVANQGYCDVFKLDEYVRSHLHFERLGPLSNIADLEYFRVGFNHFLAIGHSYGQNLYTWKSGEFAMKQDIAFPDVVQIHASVVESCRDDVILLMIKGDGKVYIFVYNSEKEEFGMVNADSLEDYTVRPGSVTSFSYRSSVVVLYKSFYDAPEAFAIETSLKSLKDILLVESEKVSDIMKDIETMLNTQTKEIERIKKILESAVRTNGNQTITGVQHFHDISSTIETVVQEVNEFEIEWEDSSLTLEEYRRGADDLEKEVEKLENLVMEIEKVIPDVVFKDQDTVITGQKIFTGNVVADTLIATSLNIERVADMNLAQLQKDVYRLDKPEPIQGTLTFKEPLTITGNLDVENTVNGIDISEEVMTTHTEQNSNAQMVFTNKLVIDGNLDVSGKVNDIDISEEVITLRGTHHITGHKDFGNGIEADNVETKLLDGVYINDLYNRAFTVSGQQTITGDTMFSAITTNDILLKGRLNGYDVRELDENIVRIDRPTTITGHKTFTKDVFIDGALFVNGTINGLRIPDDLFLADESQTVTGTKEFLGHVSANQVIVQEKVDGINIPEDVITLSGDEEISSTLYFADGIVAEQNIVVEGLVDGVDISEIVTKSFMVNDSNEFTHTVFLGPVNITGDLAVKGLINQVDLTSLVNDIVYKDENPVEIHSKKNFTKVTAGRVKLDHSINGYNIGVDFMRVHGPQVINGTKTFKQAVSFNSINIEDEMIDGLKLSDIYNQRIVLGFEDSEINNEVVFAHNVIVGNLIVRGGVNGLSIPEDVVLRYSTQEQNQAHISNKHFADRVVVDNLIVDGDINVENFGGKNLAQFYKDRITLDTPQEIYGDIWIGNSTALKVTISGLVNGLNFTEFAHNVMSKTKPQIVTAAKEFSGNVSVHGPMTTGQGVNGFNLSDIKKRAFKLQENNVVTAPLEFEDNISFKTLDVSGDINGVNITRLSEDSLKRSGLQIVKGDTIFNAGFHVVGDILATKVNGLVIPKDVLLKSVPQEISGQFTFGSVGVSGDLTINGTINGLDLSEIAPKLAKIGTETVIESNITFTKPITVHDDIEVTGTVNEVDLKTIFDNVLRKTGDQNITGNKVFRGNVTIVGDIDVDSVNGINWKEFLDDVVWKNVPEFIRSSKTFKDDVFVEKDVFISGLIHVNLVNGIDLQRFVDEAVYVDMPANITGPIVFKGPVEITGDMNAELINGLRLKTDVITIMCSDDGPQVITGQKTFQNVKVFGDVYANTVNTYNLQDLYHDTLLTEGNQNVTGRKIISGDVIFKKDVHPDTVNGMILSRDLITTTTDQKIERPLTFIGDVFVEKDLVVGGLLNGVDLMNLSREAVYLNTDQVIEGSYTIQNAVVSSNVEVDGTVNGIDLRVFDRNVTDFLKDTSNSLAIMTGFVEEHCELAKGLQDSLNHLYYSLDSFVVHQELEIPASFINVRSEQDISLSYLDDKATMVTSVQNIWDINSKRFYVGNASTSLVARSHSYKIGSIHLVINIGVNNRDSNVVVQGRPSNIPRGFTDASVVVREQEAVVTLLFPEEKTCNTYLVKEHSDNPYSPELIASAVVGKDATAIVMFELYGVLYMAVAISSSPYHRESSKIFTKTNGSWQRLQDIRTSSSSFVKHFMYQNYHYLAFTNNAPVYETKEPKSIQVYRNSGSKETMFSLFQKVPFDDTKGMDVFRFGDLSQLHLIAWNETRIQIFGLEGESGMRNYFTIHEKCVKDVKPLLVAKDFYLVVGRQNLKTGDNVQSILYKGLTKGFKYEPYDMVYC